MTGLQDEALPAFEGSEAAFSEVAFAHWRMDRARMELGGASPELEGVFRRLLHSFERRHGQVVEAYWATASATAAALTAPPRTFVDRLLRVSPAPVLHTAIDWTSELDEESKRLVHRCEILAIRAGESLGGAAARVALHWVFSTVAFILSRADRATRTGGEGVPKVSDSELRTESGPDLGDHSTDLEPDLRRIEAYVERAAAAASARNYFFGVLVGLLAVVAVTVAVELVLGSVPFADAAAVAVVAGAVGAAVSVIQRSAGDGAGIPGEIGVSPVVGLGVARPLLGAVFGVAAYFLLATEHVTIGGEEAPTFAAVAFAAGFLERTARALMLSPGAFPEPAASKALEIIERLPDALEDSVRSTLRGRPLAKWTGWVSAAVRRQPARVEHLHEPHTLEVTFSASGQPPRGARAIAIREGLDEDPVVFELRADSDSVLVRHGEQRIAVPVGGTATASMPITPPREPGHHRIWVHVLQRNRVVQIVTAELEGAKS